MKKRKGVRPPKETFWFEKIPGNDFIVKAKTIRAGRVYEIDVMAIPEDMMVDFESKNKTT